METEEPLNTADFPVVLVVEDDWEIASLVASVLHQNSFTSITARDWTTVREAFGKRIPDIVILDIMLPGDDGFTILRRLREQFDTPVIMLTAKGDADDRVKGLTLGADDYVTKPFHSAELVARVRSVLKRTTNNTATPAISCYEFGGWIVDSRKRSVSDPHGVAVVLTSGEFNVLEVFCRNAGVVLSRDRLSQLAENRMVEPYDRRIDTLVSRIRRKLQHHTPELELIKTVRHKGYLFTPSVSEQPGP
ncbi:MAG: response regulator transcription factor [Pseudomonadota bacterium]